jgi:hypothetical protein
VNIFQQGDHFSGYLLFRKHQERYIVDQRADSYGWHSFFESFLVEIFLISSQNSIALKNCFEACNHMASASIENSEWKSSGFDFLQKHGGQFFFGVKITSHEVKDGARRNCFSCTSASRRQNLAPDLKNTSGLTLAWFFLKGHKASVSRGSSHLSFLVPF